MLQSFLRMSRLVACKSSAVSCSVPKPQRSSWLIPALVNAAYHRRLMHSNHGEPVEGELVRRRVERERSRPNRAPVLTDRSPVAPLLEDRALVVQRYLEMGQLVFGYEMANRYALQSIDTGQIMGFLLETSSVFQAIQRNFLRRHRPFLMYVTDPRGNPLLQIRRPWYIFESTIYVEDLISGKTIGEVHMDWHPLRRRYDLFLDKVQFGRVDEPFMSWFSFTVMDQYGDAIATVDKNFQGLAREFFTDAHRYIARLGDDSNYSLASASGRSGQNKEVLTYDERAVVLALAVTVDFDYFSRHS
eukprot:Clim_evm49s108 gene=Clim_evmTU49s108